MRTVITGIGIVSPAGVGKEALWEAFSNGCQLIAPVERLGGAYLGAEVRGFSFEAFDDRRFRRASFLTKLALVAAKLALEDAHLNAAPGCLDGMRTAVVSAVTHGSLGLSTEYHKGYLLEGPSGASPVLFSDSVLNATAGSLSLAFSARGPSHTLVGGPPAGFQALSLASGLIGSGRAEICLVSAAEVLEAILADSYERLSGFKPLARRFTPGEGAAVVVIEGLESALRRGARPIAELAGCSVRSGADCEKGLRESIRRALLSSAVDAGSITGVMASRDPWYGDMEEKVLGEVSRAPVATLSDCIGDSFAFSSLASVCMGAVSVEGGGGCVLAVSAGLPGEAGATLVRRVPA